MLFISLCLFLFSTTVAQGSLRFDPPGWLEVSEVSGDMTLSGLPTGGTRLFPFALDLRYRRKTLPRGGNAALDGFVPA